MLIKVRELRKLIKESYERLLTEAEIDKRSVEIWHYPPGQTRTSDGRVNKQDYFVAIDLTGNQVGDGESEEEAVRSVRGKYQFVRKKEGHPISINPAEKRKLAQSKTEYIDIKTGKPVDPSTVTKQTPAISDKTDKYRTLPEPGKSAEQHSRDISKAEKIAKSAEQQKKTDALLKQLNADNLFNL